MVANEPDSANLRHWHPAPYTSRRPVPTHERYDKHLEHRNAESQAADPNGARPTEPGLFRRAAHAIRSSVASNGHDDAANWDSIGPYYQVNQDRGLAQNASSQGSPGDKRRSRGHLGPADDAIDGHRDTRESQSVPDSAPQSNESHHKLFGKKSGDRARVVTDPVTHLQVRIHDTTTDELHYVPENVFSDALQQPQPAKGGLSQNRSPRKEDDLESPLAVAFPPPSFEIARVRFTDLFQRSIVIALAVTSLTVVVVTRLLWAPKAYQKSSGLNKEFTSSHRPSGGAVTLALVVVGIGCLFIYGLRAWVESKVRGIWRDEVWEAERKQGEERAKSEFPESTQWLNSVLESVWPLVNPDLFTSLADTLEDVMQASLPTMVRMISVEDLGQGSETVRVLGVRVLPTEAARTSVSLDGRPIPSPDQSAKKIYEPSASDQSTGNEPESDAMDGEKREAGGPEEEEVPNGLEGEDGEFVNLEIAFAYRARSTGKGLKRKAENAHLYISFYLPGGIRFPVWVEVKGVVGTLRTRLQLTPDPPFFATCTLTLLGQPKVDLSCLPLTKKGLNIMDLPLISHFVQKSVDAAMAEYVAPRSLSLDLKRMIVGEDFKMDTVATGILVVTIKRAWGFVGDDSATGGLMKKSIDPYVAVGWAKYNKPLWSTRVIRKEQNPTWDETTFLLVGPDELNAGERLKLQLWDSGKSFHRSPDVPLSLYPASVATCITLEILTTTDRLTADDALGVVEVELKVLTESRATKGHMSHREDALRHGTLNGDKSGKLAWCVGFYPKIGILPMQLRKQKEDEEIENISQLKQKVTEDAEKKLREVPDEVRSRKLPDLKSEGLKSIEARMIASAPPPEEYPSGILSIHIHQAYDVGIEQTNRPRDEKANDSSSGDEEGRDLPSCYCCVILNHRLVFQTRTKPKNSDPFFNAGTEKCVRDWRNTEVIVAVRDSRVHEQDPVLGLVIFPLDRVFKETAHVHDRFPIVGGIGYGRIRVSMVFRSVQLQAPKELLGWDYGTIEVRSPITSTNLPEEVASLRLALRTAISKVKLIPTDDGWKVKRDSRICLAVQRRYHACLVLEFRKSKSHVGPDRIAAFSVVWLKDIPDNEDTTLTVPVWLGHANLKRAEYNCGSDWGEAVGHVKVPLRFWPGLSAYHGPRLSKDKYLHDVSEVLRCADDEKDALEHADSNADGSDAPSSDSDAEKPNGAPISFGQREKRAQEHERSSGGMGTIKGLKQHASQLHKRHRGLMQWQGPRTMVWMKSKVRHAKNHLGEHFQHHDERDPGIEKEV